MLLPVVAKTDDADYLGYIWILWLQIEWLLLVKIDEACNFSVDDYGSDSLLIYITYHMSSFFFPPQDNQKVYVFHQVDGSLPFHLKASLLEEHPRGAEI